MNYKHGMIGTPTYYSWRAMRTRCDWSKHHHYKNYGGKGITYCKTWKSFSVFFSDMGERPKGTTLERKNNLGNYCKNNCVWATRIEQANNKRSNKLFVVDGETITLSNACRKYNMPYQRVWQRVYRDNWSIEKALEL